MVVDAEWVGAAGAAAEAADVHGDGAIVLGLGGGPAEEEEEEKQDGMV